MFKKMSGKFFANHRNIFRSINQSNFDLRSLFIPSSSLIRYQNRNFSSFSYLFKYSDSCKSSSEKFDQFFMGSRFSETQTRNFVTKMDGKPLQQQQENELEEQFDSTFNLIIQDIYSEHSEVPHLFEVKQWLEKAFEYNISNGKRNRAKSLLLAYRNLSQEINDETIRKACILGWCVEFLQSFFLIYDDIMDNSITRRGQLCWYRQENVGFVAINDGLMINNTIYFLLKRYFGSSPIYLNLTDLFNEITRYTAYGQCLDVLSNPENKPVDLTKFTNERYNTIVQFKTGYYSFCLPIRLAMYLANIIDPQIHANSEKILLEIGHFFQVQDDYLDFFGDPNITGKIGTDIEDGKCSWLVIQALKLANQKQKTIIDQNYGIKSKDSVDKIKEIYLELKLDQVFKEYEQNKYDEICRMIESIDDASLSKDVFYNLLNMIHKRKK